MLIHGDVDVALDRLIDVFIKPALKLRHAGTPGPEIVELFREHSQPPEGLPEDIADALRARAINKLMRRFQELAIYCYDESPTIH